MKHIMKAGFTLIETTLVLAIFSLLVYLSSASFIQMQKARLLTDNLWQVVSVLRQSQSQAAAGEASGSGRLRFGVLFGRNFYQEFTSLTDYGARNTSFDFTTNLPERLEFTDFNLPGSCVIPNDCIIFSGLEGTPSAGGSISLTRPKDNSKKTVYINQQGGVSY